MEVDSYSEEVDKESEDQESDQAIMTTSRNPSNPKDWCQDSWGPDQFPAPKSPSENNYYLFNSRF